MYPTGSFPDYSSYALNEDCLCLRVSDLAKIDCNWQLPL
jgi:hypothetical protein